MRLDIDGIPYFRSPIIRLRKRIPLHVMVTSTGKSRVEDTSYRYHGLERERRPFCSFQYTLEGEGELVYEGRLHRLTPGTVMLVLIPHDHCYRLPETSDRWDFIYVSLAGSELVRIVRHIHRLVGPVFCLPDDSLVFDSFVRIYETIRREGILSEFELSSLSYSFIMALLQEICGLNEIRVNDSAAIQRTKDYCEEHFSENIGVDYLASIAGYSNSHFSRRFASLVGTSPHRYLEQKRIDEAVRLLMDPALSVKEVAIRCGFSDLNYFCRIFKRRFCLSPGGYRKGQKLIFPVPRE